MGASETKQPLFCYYESTERSDKDQIKDFIAKKRLFGQQIDRDTDLTKVSAISLKQILIHESEYPRLLSKLKSIQISRQIIYVWVTSSKECPSESNLREMRSENIDKLFDAIKINNLIAMDVITDELNTKVQVKIIMSKKSNPLEPKKQKEKEKRSDGLKQSMPEFLVVEKDGKAMKLALQGEGAQDSYLDQHQQLTKFHTNLLSNQISVQICESIQQYHISQMYSRADFVVAHSQWSKMTHKGNIKYCFEVRTFNENQKAKNQVKGYNIRTEEVEREILKGEKKGYRIKLIKEVFIIMEKDDEVNKQGKLKKLEEKYSQITFRHINRDAFGRIRSELERREEIAILFLSRKSESIQGVREALKDARLLHKVLIMTTHSFPLKVGTVSPVNENLCFRFSNKITRFIDVVTTNKSSLRPDEDEKLQKFLKHIRVFTSSQAPRTLEQYFAIESIASCSQFLVFIVTELTLIVEGEVINQLRHTIQKKAAQFKDKKKMFYVIFKCNPKLVLTVKAAYLVLSQQKQQNCRMFFVTTNEQVSEIVTKNRVETLNLYTITHEEQTKMYHEIAKMYTSIERGGKVYVLDGELSGHHHTFVQQVNFFKNSKSEEHWKVQLQNLLNSYCKIWKLEFLPIKNFKQLKDDCLKSLVSLYRNRVIEMDDERFYKEYYDRISGCLGMEELAKTLLYLFTLPYGMKEGLNLILMNVIDNIRVTNVFKPLLFLILFNWTIAAKPKFESTNKTLKVYFNSLREKGFIHEANFQEGDRLFNLNFVECWSTLEEEKDRIEIDHCYVPYQELSPFYNILKIDSSFYSKGAQYIFSPFSCFEFIEKITVNGCRVFRFKHVFNESFLSTLFKITLSDTNPIKAILDNTDTNMEETLLNELRKEYFNWIDNLRQNKINLAQHHYQNLKTIREKSKTDPLVYHRLNSVFYGLEETFLMMKNGEYTKALKRFGQIDSRLWKDFGSKNKMTRESILDSLQKFQQKILRELQQTTDLDFIHSQEEPYQWESIYKESVDEFCLFEAQGTKSKDFAFVRTPKQLFFTKPQEDCGWEAFEYTKIERIVEGMGNKKEDSDEWSDLEEEADIQSRTKEIKNSMGGGSKSMRASTVVRQFSKKEEGGQMPTIKELPEQLRRQNSLQMARRHFRMEKIKKPVTYTSIYN